MTPLLMISVNDFLIELKSGYSGKNQILDISAFFRSKIRIAGYIKGPDRFGNGIETASAVRTHVSLDRSLPSAAGADFHRGGGY